MLAALSFQKTQSPEVINAFWDEAVAKIDAIAGKHGVGGTGVRVAVLQELLKVCGMRGERWAATFDEGFPLVGRVSYPGVYPVVDHGGPHLTVDELLSTAPAKWDEIYRLPCKKEDLEDLWEVTMQERNSGWLEGPYARADVEVSVCLPVNRFLVRQGEGGAKKRPIDNMRRSGINEACLVHTPVVLPSVDHVAHMANAMWTASGDVHFWKADHESAYKQLRLAPGHSWLALTAVQDPASGELMFFRPLTLPFGAVSSVAHYTATSRMVASLAARLLRLPVVGYFDDFCGVSQPALASRALQLFEWLNATLGLRFKAAKCEYGPSIEFLGVELSAGADGVWAQITEKRRGDLLEIVRRGADSGEMRRADAEVLAGKLGFAQFYTFGRFGRAYLTRLYAHAAGGPTHLSAETRSDLRWWVGYLAKARPRLKCMFSPKPSWVAYSDACGAGGIGAIVVGVRKAGFGPVLEWSDQVGSARMEEFATATNLIYGLEVYAALWCVKRLIKICPGGPIMLYVDNDAATSSLIAGRSKVGVVNELVREFWALLSEAGTPIWIERVSSKSNPADAPSRGGSVREERVRRGEQFAYAG